VTGGPDPLQSEVARIALAAAHRYGFALGGGLALVMYGVVDRPTEDVDVFSDAAEAVSGAAGLVEAALRTAGFEVLQIDDGGTLSGVAGSLATYLVEWELHRGDAVVRLTLSCQARRRAPITMDVGPVMDIEDLLAWKTAALVGRARERDYVDIAAFLDRYRPDQLLFRTGSRQTMCTSCGAGSPHGPAEVKTSRGSVVGVRSRRTAS
jgi:nucleotidyltransferase AbiEii toxin of type IV toxin-antitoxin system